MIKKILLTLILCCIMISCGKKEAPKYEGNEMTFPKSID